MIDKLVRSRALRLVAVATCSWRFWSYTAIAAAVSTGLYLVGSLIFGDASDVGHPYYKMGSDRVLLMNGDDKTDSRCTVAHQGWGAVSASREVFWETVATPPEEGDDTKPSTQAGVTSYLPMLQAGMHFRLWTKNYGQRLWELMFCRQGNTFPNTTQSGATGLVTTQNYLPFSSKSKSASTATGSGTLQRRNVGQIVMQNTTNAQVVSSCYSEGIGTVYFDAVNGFTGYRKGQLAVEVAYGVWPTNETGNLVKDQGLATDSEGNLVPPDDFNCDQIRQISQDGDTETNLYGRCAWTRVKVIIQGVAAGKLESLLTNETATLAMPRSGSGGTYNNFYRIWAPVQDAAMNPAVASHCHGPMRFRLLRVDNPYGYVDLDGIQTTYTQSAPSQNALILVDNVIASYPAMYAAATPYGGYVADTDYRNIIGWEGVTSSRYPAIGEKNLKATAALAVVSNTPPATVDYSLASWVTAASFNSRWRYLSQQIGSWQSLPMAVVGDCLESGASLSVGDKPGDIEFYYEVELDAPYYSYVDFSGSTILSGLGSSGYSERVKKYVTRLTADDLGKGGLPTQEEMPTLGTDFFFRLREGKSDLREFRLELRKGSDASATNAVSCWLIGDRTWRTSLKTTADDVGTWQFRVVAYGDITNVFGSATGVSTNDLPLTGGRLNLATLVGGDDGWANLEIDAAANALVFQLTEDETSEEVMTFSIVHADVQNFNKWSDAKKDYFVGTSTEDESKTGTSPDAREYPSDIPAWQQTQSTDSAYWKESFIPDSGKTPLDGYGGYPAYTTFGSSYTPNGWESGQGMWVCAKYRESAENGDMALQMEGQGRGSLTYQNTPIPAGLEKVVFKARVAQFGGFGDFSTWSGRSTVEMTNYLFTTRAIMQTDSSAEDFNGNGTISLVGYYQASGCYEARVERVSEKNINLLIYKWYAKDGQIVSTNVATYALSNRYSGNKSTNLKRDSSDEKNASYASLFIQCQTVSDKTVVTAGLMYNDNVKLETSASGKNHYCLRYTDTTDSRLKCGKFGLSSLNCNAQFIDPRVYWNGNGTVYDKAFDSKGQAATTVKFSGTQPNPLFNYGTSAMTGSYANWDLAVGRFDLTTVSDGSKMAVKAKVSANDVIVQTIPSPKGKTDKWETVGTQTVSGFNLIEYTLPVYSKSDVSVRLVAGGDVSSTRTDIVVDDVVLHQWRAADYDDGSDSSFTKEKFVSRGCPTNYVYLCGWVDVADGRHKITFEPVRARTNGVDLLSIRSPLLDGRDDGYGARGQGLGMFSYSYENADSNCVIVIQYAEIDGTTDLASDTKSLDSSIWHDAMTTDFSELSEEERKSGTISCYVGLHGVRGAMRLIVKPQVVADAADPVKNPKTSATFTDYGKITITSVLCRDEPTLDERAWWGWNLRTTDSPSMRSLYDGVPTRVGLALALNNSISKDTDPDPTVADLYKQHVPFVQTPTFATASGAGEVSFKARKYSSGDGDTEVAVLGSTSGSVSLDTEWKVIDVLVVTNSYYETYSCKVRKGQGYKAFRLAVIGVEGVTATNYSDRVKVAKPVPRVLLDEAMISEAVYGEVRFFDVGAFRTPLDTHTYVENLLDKAQQPMCEEVWSVQCEVRAVQLAQEVLLDDDTEVTLYWYKGKDKWGYDNWSGEAKSAKLARIKGAPGFVFRGSYPEAKQAVIDPVYESGAVVQYMLSVKYKNADGTWADPYYMTGTDWSKPSWYAGVDYNAQYGGFAAYTILDTVAYGYAWINEVNLFDGPGLYNDQRTNQFVEVAVPSEANIKGWKLQFLTGGLGDTAAIYTNTVVTFSDPKQVPTGVPCTKSLNMDAASKYVFITAGSPSSCSDDLKEKGYIDGPWHVDSSEERGAQLSADGKIDVGMPIGIRLVRPSGVVEHQIVVAGTNRYSSYRAPYPRVYSTTNLVARFNALDADSAWYTPCCEDRGTNATLAIGVTNFIGVITNANVWAHLAKTPGRINGGEYIPSEHPHPLGAMLVLYAQLSGGYIDQTVGDETNATTDISLYVPKGLPNGTNILYRVANWHQIESITETTEKGTTIHPGPAGHPKTYVFSTMPYASNDITVVAKTCMRKDLSETYGLTADNAYTPAVLAWLEDGVRHAGKGAFANQGGEIELAKVYDLSGSYVEDMRLTEMYWLDMDPTVGDTVLQLGMSASPYTKDVVRVGTNGTQVTCKDGVVKVKMKIYSTTGAFEPYAPYTLNGIESGRSSCDDASGWDSETFKITFHLQNGLDEKKDPSMVWMPVRYFVFDTASFDSNFEALIQVIDPFYQLPDWSEWVSEIPEEGRALYRFSIDTRKFGAAGSDVLRPDSTFP